MGRICSVFLVGWLLIMAPWCVVSGAEEYNRDDSSCGKERYDDFFRIQKEKDALYDQRIKSAKGIKSERMEREKQLEEARRAYRREKTTVNPRLELEWNEQVKADNELQEMNRRRFVKNRDDREKSRCSLRKVPELKEFELEDY